MNISREMNTKMENLAKLNDEMKALETKVKNAKEEVREYMSGHNLATVETDNASFKIISYMRTSLNEEKAISIINEEILKSEDEERVNLLESCLTTQVVLNESMIEKLIYENKIESTLLENAIEEKPSVQFRIGKPSKKE